MIKGVSNNPTHVAIIMDGNGRWALSKGLKRSDGHKEGVKRVQRIIELSLDLGVKYLTLYTFSNENWTRPTNEIDSLFSLLARNLLLKLRKMKKNGVRFYAIGNLEKMPILVRQRIKTAIKDTAVNDKLHLTIALSYSTRWEMVQAVQHIAEKVQKKKLAIHAIDEIIIQQHLATAYMPDPDILIRTGGETRISNFLLYQLAYAELFFTPTCWPDFSDEEYEEIIETYKKRKRTFGSVI